MADNFGSDAGTYKDLNRCDDDCYPIIIHINKIAGARFEESLKDLKWSEDIKELATALLKDEMAGGSKIGSTNTVRITNHLKPHLLLLKTVFPNCVEACSCVFDGDCKNTPGFRTFLFMACILIGDWIEVSDIDLLNDIDNLKYARKSRVGLAILYFTSLYDPVNPNNNRFNVSNDQLNKFLMIFDFTNAPQKGESTVFQGGIYKTISNNNGEPEFSKENALNCINNLNGGNNNFNSYLDSDNDNMFHGGSTKDEYKKNAANLRSDLHKYLTNEVFSDYKCVDILSFTGDHKFNLGGIDKLPAGTIAFFNTLFTMLNRERNHIQSNNSTTGHISYYRIAPSSIQNKNNSTGSILSVLQNVKQANTQISAMSPNPMSMIPSPFWNSTLRGGGNFKNSKGGSNITMDQIDKSFNNTKNGYKILKYIYDSIIQRLSSKNVTISTEYSNTLQNLLEDYRIKEDRLIKKLKILSILRYADEPTIFKTIGIKPIDGHFYPNTSANNSNHNIHEKDVNDLSDQLENTCFDGINKLHSKCANISEMLQRVAKDT